MTNDNNPALRPGQRAPIVPIVISAGLAAFSFNLIICTEITIIITQQHIAKCQLQVVVEPFSRCR